MSDKSQREVPQIVKLPSIGKSQLERPRTPQPDHFLASKVSQYFGANSHHSGRYDDHLSDRVDQSQGRRMRPSSRVGGKKLGRNREEELKKRDQERLAAILKKGNPEWLANSKSETSLFKVPKRSQQILQELCNDGFIATHSVGGLAFDVSLGGRPVRLSPIGKRMKRTVCSGSKKRKKSHRNKSGKRKKRDKGGKRKTSRSPICPGSEKGRGRTRGAKCPDRPNDDEEEVDEDDDDNDEVKEDDDWEDYEIEFQE